MIKYLRVVLPLTALLAWSTAHTLAGDAATPQEVIAKVKEAATYLQKNGKAGLKTFDSADSPFVFKNTYVFVYNCGAGLADIAHPVARVKVNPIAAHKDATRRVTGPEQCKLAERPNGGWMAYMWWRPRKVEGQEKLVYDKQPSRKVTYMLGVKGQPYEVGAGIYNDTTTVKELDALLVK